MVFEIFRELSYPFSCHALIIIQRGRQSSYDNICVSVEDTRAQGV